jgi:hypothetical protein
MFILLTSLFTVSTYVGLKSNSVLCCVLFLIYNDERRDRHYHLYCIESGRLSCDISDKVCGDFRLGRDCFNLSGHNVLDVTLTDKCPLHT